MYAFEITDILLKEHFLSCQKDFENRFQNLGIIYIAALDCSLESVLHEIEYMPFDLYDDFELLRSIVISYWFSNWSTIDTWRNTLKQANQQSKQDNLIIFRTVHLPTFRNSLELMMQR